MTQNPNKLQSISPLALPQTKRKPLGDGIDWSDDTVLDALANIDKADIVAATSLWEHEAPSALKGLLKAKVEGQSSE